MSSTYFNPFKDLVVLVKRKQIRSMCLFQICLFHVFWQWIVGLILKGGLLLRVSAAVSCTFSFCLIVSVVSMPEYSVVLWRLKPSPVQETSFAEQQGIIAIRTADVDWMFPTFQEVFQVLYICWPEQFSK